MQTEPDAKHSQEQRRVQSASVVVSHNTAAHSERVLTFPSLLPSLLMIGRGGGGVWGAGEGGGALEAAITRCGLLLLIWKK